MTDQQLYGFTCLYLVLTAAAAVVTRATPRRIVGALSGAAVCPGGIRHRRLCGASRVVAHRDHVGAVFPHTSLGQRSPLRIRFPSHMEVARRFGRRGLAVLLVISSVLGLFRDSWFMARFPEWGSYAPGIAPMLAISAAYVLVGSLGHGTMRLVAGRATAIGWRADLGKARDRRRGCHYGSE